MGLVRRLARPLLAASFVSTGIDGLRHPADRVAAAERYGLPSPETAVKVNSAVMTGAGLALATGRLPRTSGLLLAGGYIPVTLATSAFWEATDPGTKATQRAAFVRNLGLIGGALLAAVDLEGRESVGRKARRVSRGASRKAAKKAAKATRKAAEASAKTSKTVASTTAPARQLLNVG